MVEVAPFQRKRIKKFYKTVEVAAAEGGATILLDGKPAMTPARRALSLPSRSLAEAVAVEWQGEGEAVDFDGMRLTRLAVTAIDLAVSKRAAWADEIAAYGRSDHLCYRAEEPRELVARQRAAWTPFLDWAREEVGAMLVATEGVMTVAQDEAAIAALRSRAAALTDWRLVAASHAATLTGSAVLALALEAGAFPKEQIFAASRLDERFQAEKWGVDAEAAAREARLEAEFSAVAHWLRLA